MAPYPINTFLIIFKFALRMILLFLLPRVVLLLARTIDVAKISSFYFLFSGNFFLLILVISTHV